MRPSPVSPETMARLVVLLTVLLAHWSDLSGWLSSNPIYFCAGIPLQWSGRVLPGFPGWVDFHAGATLQALATLAARDWLHGVLPWWNPYAGVGLPLGAQLQSAPFFLPFVLMEHFFDGTLYLKIIMQVIAGQATYMVLRHLRVFRAAAVTGAVLYELNGTFAWFADVPIMPIPFLPVCVLGIEQALTAAGQGRGGGWILITIAIAYLIVAGFPETAYFCGLLALAWGICRYIGAGGFRRAFAGKVIGGGSLGLMIATPVLFAFASYLFVAWPEPRAMAYSSLLPANLAMYLFPYIYGPIHYAQQYDLWFHMGGYLGLCPLFLAIVGLVGGHRERGLRWLLAAWVMVSLAKSAALPGVTELVNLVPAVTQTMFFRYIAPTIAFAGCVMAALALDDWRRACWQRPPRVIVSALLVTALASGGVLVVAKPLITKLMATADYWLYPLLSVAAAGFVVAIVAMLLLQNASSKASLALCGLVIAEAAALFTVPLLAGTRRNQIDLAPVRFLQANLGLNRYYSLGPLGPNYGAYFGIASVNHNYLPLAARWADFVVADLDPGITPNLNIFNGTFPDALGRIEVFKQRMSAFASVGVKYVVVYHSIDPFAGSKAGLLKIAFSDPLVSIYELPDAAPYFEVTDGGPCDLHLTIRGRVRGHCETPATLVRRELFFPGWHAVVNGKPVKIHEHGPIFQSVDLPAGDFDLRFSYSPLFIEWTYPVCLVGFIGVAIGAVVHLRSRLRRHCADALT